MQKKINMPLGLDLETIFGMKFFHYAPALSFFFNKTFLTMPMDLEKFSIFFFHYAPGLEEKI